jgi:hypothetical protein
MTVRASCKFKESAVVSLLHVSLCYTRRVLHILKCLMPVVTKSALYGPVFFIPLQGLYRGAGASNRKRNLQKAYAHFENVDKFISYLALQLRYL